MRWTLIAASVLVAGALSLPAHAASPTPAPAAGVQQGFTFAQYRDWRIHEFAQRRQRLAELLSATDLSPATRAKLEQRKAYYGWLAAMPAAVRDRRFRARFDQIDTNHDGKLDQAERAAWREKERQYYRHLAQLRKARQAQ